MRNGTGPTRIRRRDRDYIKSFHPGIFAGTAAYPVFPAEYLTDTTGWKPDQDADGKPYGCTDYATTKIARILGFASATVDAIEAVTHANALGGFGVLASIDAARTVLGWFTWRYIIQATGSLDFFDASRLAQVSGLPEQRAISAGSPWFPSWEQAVLAGKKILPMPSQAELSIAHTNPSSLPWHDYVLDGWSQNFPEAPGRLLYRIDSWQGSLDYLYVDRATLNTVMDLFGTIEVVATNRQAPAVSTISLPDWFWSLWHSWLGVRY